MKSLNGRNLKKNFSYELLKGQNWTHEKKVLLNFFSIFKKYTCLKDFSNGNQL
jgi:hypothetical protein